MYRITILAALIVAGCTTSPVLRSPDSFAIEHDIMFTSSAFQQAETHCANYDKNAVHVSTSGGLWKISSFRCE